MGAARDPTAEIRIGRFGRSARGRCSLPAPRAPPTPLPGPAPPPRPAVRRCYNSPVMDESNVRDPEPLESAPSAEARAETVEELRRQVEEKQDRLLRALAEVENIKRRTQREREEYIRYANESLLRDLVPVLDNLDRALEAARGTGEVSGVVGGVELIQRELLKVLERAGVT